MNKKTLIAVLSLGIFAFSGIGIASAQQVQNDSKQTSARPQFGMGRHRIENTQQRELHRQALADFLKINIADLQTQIQSGKTLEQIALAQGIGADELKAFFDTQRQIHMDARIQRMSEKKDQVTHFAQRMGKEKSGVHGPRNFFGHKGMGMMR
jgi:hypothetical protein